MTPTRETHSHSRASAAADDAPNPLDTSIATRLATTTSTISKSDHLSRRPPPSFFPYPALDHSVAGILAGLVTTSCMHPLDLLKTRMQVAQMASFAVPRGRTGLLWRHVSRLRQEAGSLGWRGTLYRGFQANLAGSTASWYTVIKGRMARESSTSLTGGQHLTASFAAGALTALMTNPLWVVKTRMCIHEPHQPAPYRNLLDALLRMGREEGLRGYYKGIVPALLGVSHGAIQFMVYEEMKQWRRPSDPQRSWFPSGTLGYIAMAATSKSIATLLTYPYQVLRSRLQDHRRLPASSSNASSHGTVSLLKVMVEIWRTDGVLGFYRGLLPNLARLVPGTCITFAVYEAVTGALRSNATEWVHHP